MKNVQNGSSKRIRNSTKITATLQHKHNLIQFLLMIFTNGYLKHPKTPSLSADTPNQHTAHLWQKKRHLQGCTECGQVPRSCVQGRHSFQLITFGAKRRLAVAESLVWVVSVGFFWCFQNRMCFSGFSWVSRVGFSWVIGSGFGLYRGLFEAVGSRCLEFSEDFRLNAACGHPT